MCVCVCVLKVRNIEGSATVTTWCSLLTISTNRLLRSGFNNNNNNNNNNNTFQLEDGGTRLFSNLHQRLTLISKNKIGEKPGQGYQDVFHLCLGVSLRCHELDPYWLRENPNDF